MFDVNVPCSFIVREKFPMDHTRSIVITRPAICKLEYIKGLLNPLSIMNNDKYYSNVRVDLSCSFNKYVRFSVDTSLLYSKNIQRN